MAAAQGEIGVGLEPASVEQRQQSQWAAHALTDEEWSAFQSDGYLRLPPVPQELIDRASAAARRLVAEKSTSRDGRTKITGLIGRDVPDGAAFLDLMDCPTTFPKVVGIMGWNIQLLQTNVDFSPPNPAAIPGPSANKTLGFHQDNNRMGQRRNDWRGPDVEVDETTLGGDLGTAVHTHPMMSVKIIYFLEDCPPGTSNLYLLPGSHTALPPPGAIYPIVYDNDAHDAQLRLPIGAVELVGKKGEAVLFDRRCFHAASPNLHPDAATGPSRLIAFYAYSYRWLRPKNDWDHSHTEMVAHLCGPVRHQLLGAQPGGSGATFSPASEDVPLARVADACGLLRPPDAVSSIPAKDAAQLQLAEENAQLRAENALLRAAATTARGKQLDAGAAKL